ncbi:histidinol-phosphate transaminase, partial [Candidatus Sumerlaeota bacterium]|nr:histidinol-phosphate transaminase [Candidatus Sumerlaeota bacterium]
AREMNLYPDGAGFYLKQALATKLKVLPEEIILGNGSDEITIFLALSFLGAGRSIVTSNYAFVRYIMAAKLVNAAAKIVPMKNFRHDIEGIIKAVDSTTAMVFLDSPCNPTGSIITRRELSRLLKSIPPRVLIMMDEAYYEFACGDSDYPDTLALRKKHSNLIVTRTFSKAYGLAGLRIGYGVAPAGVVRDLDRVRPPFNTNRMAQSAAIAALDDKAHLRRSVANNKRGKKFLCTAFTRLGLKFVPTWGNFILVDLNGKYSSGADLYQALLRRGVIVRPMGGYGLVNNVRISIGSAGENEKLVRALESIL